MTVEFSPTLTTTDEETLPAKEALWEVASFFDLNWAVPARNIKTWLTNIKNARSQAEVRFGNIDRPSRIIRSELTALKQEDSTRIESMMMRRTFAKSRWPLYSDFTTLTADVSSGSSLLPCRVKERRFYADAFILIAKRDPEHLTTFSDFQVAQILSLGFTDDITIVGTTSIDFDEGDVIFPLIESHINLQQSRSMITDYISTFEVLAEEVEGVTAFPPLIEANLLSAPIGTPKHTFINSFEYADHPNGETYPIWDINVDWSSRLDKQIVRPGRKDNVGFGTNSSIFGDRPMIRFDNSLVFCSREDAFRFLWFFDWRGGRTFPFWFFSNDSPYEVTEVVDEFSLKIKAWFPEIDYSFRPFLGIEFTSGERYVREIDSVSRAAGIDTISWLDPLPSIGPFDPDIVGDVRQAFLMRFDSDEIEEVWTTDEIMSSSAPTIELIDERDITIANLDTPATLTDELKRFQPEVICCEDEIICPGDLDLGWFHHLGRFYIGGMMKAETGATASPTGNNLRAKPYWSGRGGHLSEIAVYANSTGGSGNARFGVYESIDDGAGNLYPGALVVSAPEVDLSTSGSKVMSVDFDLEEDRLYWLAHVQDNPNVVWRAIEADNMMPILGLDSDIPGVGPDVRIKATFTYGVLPATFPGGGDIQSVAQTLAMGLKVDS